LKAETYLKVNGIEYERIGDVGNIGKFSRGKMPVIQFNQQIVQDSSNIISFLDKTLGKSMDAELSAKDRATSTLLATVAEDSLGPILVHFRWLHQEGWPEWSRLTFGKVPFILRWIIARQVRKGVQTSQWASGVARYPPEELLAQAKDIFDALSQQLGKNKFMLGDKFHIVDASVYGVLHNIILFPLDTPLQRLAHKYDNLVSYCKHIRDMAEERKFVSKK
jgi:glutathione S-transferase